MSTYNDGLVFMKGPTCSLLSDGVNGLGAHGFKAPDSEICYFCEGFSCTVLMVRFCSAIMKSK